MGHSKGKKDKPLHKDQDSAQDAKIKHKGMSQDQGSDCCSPSEFTEKVGARDKKANASWSKMPKNTMPGDMPSGKKAGMPMSMPSSEDSKKALAKMKTTKSRNSK